MKLSEQLARAQEEVNRVKREMENCKHKWLPSIYDPETVQEPVFSHYIPRGSDPEPVYNYYPKNKDRWSRTCECCGKKEYTHTQEVVKTVKEPKF